MAIHSLKDVPSMIPDGLTLGCIPDREIPFDAYIAKNHIPLQELSEGSIVGTSSLTSWRSNFIKIPTFKN